MLRGSEEKSSFGLPAANTFSPLSLSAPVEFDCGVRVEPPWFHAFGQRHSNQLLQLRIFAEPADQFLDLLRLAFVREQHRVVRLHQN
jgi:hypothetical protein